MRRVSFKKEKTKKKKKRKYKTRKKAREERKGLKLQTKSSEELGRKKGAKG